MRGDGGVGGKERMGQTQGLFPLISSASRLGVSVLNPHGWHGTSIFQGLAVSNHRLQRRK